MVLCLVLPLVAACAAPARGDTMPPPQIVTVAPPADPLRPGPFAVGVTTRTFARRSSTTGEPRLLETVIWYPAADLARLFPADRRLRAVTGAPVAGGGPFPVVLFSHGAHSTPVQSTFLMAHLASHGIAVAAPSHPGSTFDDCLGCGTPARMQAMLQDSAANRPDDVSFVLDQLAALNVDQQSPFAGAFDATHAAVIGHSWGGYTAVVAAAKDPRFGAAVAMAPVVDQAVEQAGLALRSPLLMMVSRLDDITPYPPQARYFAALPSSPSHYLLTFPLGGHTAFSDTCPETAPGCRPGELGEQAYPLVSAYVVAFLRSRLLGDSRYDGMLSPALGGGLLEFTSGDARP